MNNLPWLLLIGFVLAYWWQSGSFKGRARELATRYCQQLELQLLDQSMVISGIWPQRNGSGSLSLRRTYQFEFTSTGEKRYRGTLILFGMKLKSIQLETYKLPVDPLTNANPD